MYHTLSLTSYHRESTNVVRRARVSGSLQFQAGHTLLIIGLVALQLEALTSWLRNAQLSKVQEVIATKKN